MSLLRSQQQEAGRRRAQAEAKLDEIASRRKRLIEALGEHGCENEEQAHKRLKELGEQSEKALAEIEEKVKGL